MRGCCGFCCKSCWLCGCVDAVDVDVDADVNVDDVDVEVVVFNSNDVAFAFVVVVSVKPVFAFDICCGVCCCEFCYLFRMDF